MSPKLPQDELLERYAQAKAALPDGIPDAPSVTLHERIMQAARAQASTINSVAPCADSMPATGLKDSKNPPSRAEAANDNFWNIKAFASLAVMGLSGLLWYQFEHGTPDEQEAAKSAKPSATIAAKAPAPASEATLVTSPEAPAVAQQAPANNAEPAAAIVVRKEAQASKPSEAKIAETEMASTSAAAPLAPVLPQLSQADKALVDIPSRRAAPNNAPEPSLQRSLEAPQAPSMAAAPPPAPAAVARAAAPSMPEPATVPRPTAPAPQAIIASPSKFLAAIEERDAPALRQALAQGLSPNARTSEGNPALQQAVIRRWAEGVRILLAAGANRSAKNNKGHTAADVAFELGYEDMSRLLEMPR